MQRARNLGIFILILALIIGLTYFGVGSKTKAATKKVTTKTLVVTDLAGRKITLKQPVKRVVAIGPGALRLVSYVDGAARIVGVEAIEKQPNAKPYILAYPQLQKLPTIGQGGPDTQPDPEKILTVKPDVIFVVQLLDKAGADRLQQQVKVPVVVLNYGQAGFFDDTALKSINLIGKILGKEKRAQELQNYVQKIKSDLAKRIGKAKSPKVYVGAVSFKGARGFESTQGSHPILKMVKAQNVADGLGKQGAITVDREQILLWDPEVVFIDEGGLSLVKEDYRKNSSFYLSLTAFKKNKVYGLLPYNSYNTNIETAFADAYYVAKVIYPTAFAGVDPVKKADEIYKFFLGKPLYQELKKKFGGFGPLKFD
ncbi:iron ABC transporter substrate-binding protein [Carboxydothermus pertinax]|uniref:Iron ABC transporter substrate-binding protein n=1 Tax=Carboxydothermus pertinax TaxID=870242 RepID=A0A1L8CV95_9THEO|nr:iron ABC transporter substrate-binding protein [Carboxydothermus pertinax]GAV22784.1 iron ABC transporter substrate-binding protein [Carboxydothermus pertinax]